MKKRVIKKCYLAGTFAIATSIAFACSSFASETKLVIYTEHFPPYNYEEDGQLKGINIEIAKEICKQANISCSFTLYPWNRAYRNAQNTPNSGLVSTARIPKRETLFQWVGPLASGTNCLYKLTSREDIQISSLKMASKYRLGISRDAVYIDLLADYGFKQDENLTLYLNKYGTLRPFAAGRVDLILGSSTTINSQLNYVELSKEDIVPVAIIDLSNVLGNYLAINKDTNPDITAKLQQALMQFRQTERFEQLSLQYRTENTDSAPSNVNPILWQKCM